MSSEGKPTISPLFTWRSALLNSDLWPRARLVGHTLAAHMNEAGDSCFPGVRRLMRETGQARQTVLDAIDDLERHGYLIVERGGCDRNGKRTANHYYAAIPDRSSEQTGPVSRPVQSRDRTGLVTRPAPVQSLEQRASSTTSCTTPEPPCSPPTPDLVPSVPQPSFEDFWAIVVRKVGKGAAKRAWKAATKKADGQRILDAYTEHAQVWRTWPAEDQRFIPHPATWLNQERWDDDPPEPKYPTNGHEVTMQNIAAAHERIMQEAR